MQQYLEAFRLPNEAAETEFILDHPMNRATCYSDNIYPFRIFPGKRLEQLSFAPVTVFCGGNGSGKSTLLNLIACKLELSRAAPFNHTPFFDEYLKLCRADLTFGRGAPPDSRIITSDDVFDYLLDLRCLNNGVDARREELFAAYEAARSTPFQMRSLEDYEELKLHNEAKSRRTTRSSFTRRRLPANLWGQSNGESAFAYFTEQIREGALYLLDEPENSLSAELQLQLVRFLEDSVRFWRCQFVLSTHSPFLLSIRDARIYDLDSIPVTVRPWTELKNVRIYHDFFERHRSDFPLEEKTLEGPAS